MDLIDVFVLLMCFGCFILGFSVSRVIQYKYESFTSAKDFEEILKKQESVYKNHIDKQKELIKELLDELFKSLINK